MSWKMLKSFLFLLLLQQYIFVYAKSNDNNLMKPQSLRKSSKTESAVSEDSVYNYLMEFDYLPKSDIETGALRTEEQLKEAIRNLQSFGNIPVTGVIDSETKKLIKRPRCGVGDNNQSLAFSPDNLHHGRMKRYVLQGPKWEKTDLTWSLVNQSMPNAGQIRLTLRKALSVWESNSKLTFREVYSDQADIQVLFAKRDHGDGYKFDGPGLILAHAFYPGSGRGGDAHFDDDENWAVTSEQLNEEEEDRGTDLLNVAVHEFGHSLGLGHSSDQKAIMFPWYQGYQVGSALPNDDRTAIQELYGSKVKIWGTYIPQARPTTTPTTTTTTTTTMRPLVYYPPNNYPNRYYPQNNPHSHHPQHYPVDRNNNRHHHPHQHYPYYNNNNTPSRTYPEHRPTTRTTTTSTTTTTTTTWRPRTQPPQRSSPKPTKRRVTHPTKPRKMKPDTCMTSYDAVSMIRGELFIFKGQYLWRIGDRGLYPGYPTETRRLWTQLPEHYNKIDAVYENRQRHIVFFIGRKYYVFDSVTLIQEQPLTSLGLPISLDHIDAAFVWGHNNRTYLFSGTLYWGLDRDTGRVELDYPRGLAIWAGIGYNIDAAFQYTNRKTYFFKGNGYWEFNDDLMRVAHSRRLPSAHKWMKCPRRLNDIDDEITRTAPLISENDKFDDTLSKGYHARGSVIILILCSLHSLVWS